MLKQVTAIIEEAISVKGAILQSPELLTTILELSQLITNTLKSGGKVWLCGNGGSAADAQHIAAELSGRFYMDRPALFAEALHVNTSYLTAVANDYGYEQVYARWITGNATANDILIALSTSGSSANIVAAVRAAKQKNMTTLGMTGKSGGQLKKLCTHLIAIPSNNTPRIQEAHIMIGHILCELVEQSIFNTNF